MTAPWPFDQAPDVAAITTRQVLREGLPVLRVVHYDDDHSWAFTCGTTNAPADGLVVDMACMLSLDSSLAEVADLPPGWGACRDQPGDDWEVYPMSDE
jgi:hypothetical protein